MIESLPDRPLTIAEADSLAQSGKLTPMTIIQKLPSDTEIQFSEDSDKIEDNVQENAVNFAVSLLYATEEKAITIAYSEKEGCWMKAVEEDAEDYDHQRVEQETHQFVKQHSESDPEDLGFVQ